MNSSEVKKPMTCPAAKRQTNLVAANGLYRLRFKRNRDLKMNNCENCKFSAIYDKNVRSILGRIWKWHISWCPGWKGYLKSLPDENRKKLREQYS